MKYLKSYVGLVLIAIGVLFLAGLHLFHFTFVNTLLLIPLCLIVAGIVIHVWILKRQSRY